jgi:hypothetical protein
MRRKVRSRSTLVRIGRKQEGKMGKKKVNKQ